MVQAGEGQEFVERCGKPMGWPYLAKVCRMWKGMLRGCLGPCLSRCGGLVSCVKGKVMVEAEGEGSEAGLSAQGLHMPGQGPLSLGPCLGFLSDLL